MYVIRYIRVYMQCHGIPYHKYVGLFAAISCSLSFLLLIFLALSSSSLNSSTFPSSKHAFTSFYSDPMVDFISSSKKNSLVFFIFRLCRRACVFTSFSFVLRACGCVQIYTQKKNVETAREFIM